MLRLNAIIGEKLWDTILAFSREHNATQVAAYWDPSIDVLCLEDPFGGAMEDGKADDEAFVEFYTRNKVQLSEFNLGNSTGKAGHCLVFHTVNGAVYISEIMRVERLV